MSIDEPIERVSMKITPDFPRYEARRMRRVVFLVLLALTCSASRVTNASRPSVSLSQIEAARLEVGKERVTILYGVVGTRRVRVGRRSYKQVPVTGIVGREMALALGGGDGAIFIVRAIKRDHSLEILTPGFSISLRRDNGINSDIVCIEPPGMKVLAIKYPVNNERNRFGPGPEVIEAVYTPYSAEIKSPELIRYGLAVQHELIIEAYGRLRARQVFSRAFEGQKVANVIPPDLVSALLLNEHIDPSEFTSPGLTKALLERVLTVVATNRERAYAYSVSPANARGLVQMIPSTYVRLLSHYPGAGLMSNFAAGMADPVNAIMAQILLCDVDWAALRRNSDLPVEKIGPYLAAAYNGGVGRVLSVVAHDQTEWMDDPESNPQPRMTISQKVPVRVRVGRRLRTKYVVKHYTASIFRAETSKYVRQYHWIKDYLVANGLDGPKL